jgi:hypothetical protein
MGYSSRKKRKPKDRAIERRLPRRPNALRRDAAKKSCLEVQRNKNAEEFKRYTVKEAIIPVSEGSYWE